MNEKILFDQLLEQAKDDSKVIGFLLLGSRGKGYEHEHSDYDVLLVVSDDYEKGAKEKYETSNDMDVGVESLTSFSSSPPWDSPDSWNRYDFTHVKVLIDANDRIVDLAERRGTMTDTEKKNVIRSSLDGYINAVFRVVKCDRSGSESGIRFESAASIPFLLDILFALENRPRPFWRYIEQELKQYPLKKLPWNVDQFIQDMLDILTTGNVKLQQRMLGEIKKVFTTEGFGKVFDDWEGKDEWILNYKSE